VGDEVSSWPARVAGRGNASLVVTFDGMWATIEQLHMGDPLW
jgi:hypothetical protein